LPDGPEGAMMYSSSQGRFKMIDTCVLHDDYEDFAQKYLGVDYEDFVGLQLGLPDEDEIEIEYYLSI
jgi:hypothetical protein